MLLAEYRSDVSPLLVFENHEPPQFTNSFPVWKEPEIKLSFEERVSDFAASGCTDHTVQNMAFSHFF